MESLVQTPQPNGQEPGDFGAYREQVADRDRFIGGYMHAAAGHTNDLTEDMFRTTTAWLAWITGYTAGLNGEHPETLIQPWCNPVVERAVAAWREWVEQRAELARGIELEKLPKRELVRRVKEYTVYSAHPRSRQAHVPRVPARPAEPAADRGCPMIRLLAAVLGLFRRPQRPPYYLLVVHTPAGTTHLRPTPYPSRGSARIAKRLYNLAHPTTFAVIREVTR